MRMSTLKKSMPLSTNQPRSAGFSLIELLVVVAIITLLAGIALPYLYSAGDTAKRTRCIANLKEISRALYFYRQDNNKKLPEVQPMPVDIHTPTLMHALAPYIKPDSGAYVSPGDEGIVALVGTSYEYHLGYFFQFGTAKKEFASNNRADLYRFFRENEAETVALLDAGSFHPGGPGGADKNALYLDGAVDWFNPKTDNAPAEGRKEDPNAPKSQGK